MFNQKYLMNFLLIIAFILLINGCSFRNENPKANPATDTRATLTLNIHWPAFSTKTIPSATNRIILYITGPNILGAASYIIDKPESQATENIEIEIPTGPKHIFAAEARQVASSEYFAPERVPCTSPKLQEGALLGVGKDSQAYNIEAGYSYNINLVISAAAIPDPSVTTVNVNVNQILVERFPAVISFQFILDQNGDPITNLNAANFELYEDEIPAVITDVRPVAEAAIESNIALALERSGSMAGQPNLDLETAATSFINLMPSNDFGEIINFADWVSVDQPFTSDKALLLQAIQGRSAFGLRPLYDAICLAVFDTTRRSGRKAIIIMSDGSDNCSWYFKEEAIGYPSQAGIPVFTVGLGGSDFSGGESFLQDIASQTRGFYYYAANSTELNDIYTKIANQFNGQMEIIFISPDPTKSNRTRNVTLVWHYGSFTGQISYQYVY